MDSDQPTLGPKRHLRVVKPSDSAPARQGSGGAEVPNRWEIKLETWPKKILAILLICTTSGILIYRTWWLFLAAWITRDKVTDVGIYERAIHYDPANADYHFVLGQIYSYSTADLNVDRAREEYEAAVRLNPYRSGYWLELSKHYEQNDNLERSRFAMTKALETDPNYAQTHWAAANLYVRLNDAKAADYELRRAADLDPTYTTQVLDLVWATYGDAEFIMNTHIPNSKESNLTAMGYFYSRGSPEGAELAWNRLKSFSPTLQERFGYVEYLINQGKPHQAWEVFSTGLDANNLFYNASFDSEIMNGGFDWRFSTSDDAEVRRDTTTVKDGMASLLVNFGGKQNFTYGEVWHPLPVDKGKSYILKFWMKTDSISTNEGVYVNVDGQVSEKQLGTTYWQEFTLPFTATSDLVRVTLRRDPSKKFDNLIKGKVWLDGFSLTPSGQQ